MGSRLKLDLTLTVISKYENSKGILGSATANELAENSLMRSSKYNQEKVRTFEKNLNPNTGFTDSHSYFAYPGI